MAYGTRIVIICYSLHNINPKYRTIQNSMITTYTYIFFRKNPWNNVIPNEISAIFSQCNETHQENVINYLHKNAYICCDFKLSMNVKC